MCNSADDEPCISGTPSQAAIQGDTRSLGQRNHDALLAAARALLASGELGQHNGLPASIIVTTTLQELEKPAPAEGSPAAARCCRCRDVIRLASHAHHYLAIFDKGKALALYHTKRLASPAQRIVLYAKDRGCSFPGCDVPGYLCEVHHCNPYATNPVTDVNDLDLGLRPQPQTRRTRLDHPQKRTRRHRMDPTSRTSTTANPASTRSITPRSFCDRMKTTRRPNRLSAASTGPAGA